MALLWANARADLEGLECSKRVGNTINRKITNFYIEAIPNFFSQLRKKIFFCSSSKKNSKNKIAKNIETFSGKIHLEKSKISDFDVHLEKSKIADFDVEI